MKTTDIGGMRYTIEITRATREQVHVMLHCAVSPCASQRWTYVRDGLRLVRVSVAWADSTELDYVGPTASARIRRIAVAAWESACQVAA